MISRSHVLLSVIGISTIAAAVIVRQTVFTRKPVSQQVASQIDARVVEMDRQLTQLQASVARNPKDQGSHWALADFFQRIHRPDKAAEQLGEILKLNPTDRAARMALGNVFVALGDHAAAGGEFRQVINTEPKRAEAWMGLATSLYHRQLYREAANAARRAVHLDKREPNYRYTLGASLLQYALQFPNPDDFGRELIEAQNCFIFVLGAWPEKGNVYYDLGRASMYLRAKRPAVRNLRRAMELIPDNPDIPRMLAQVYLSSSEREAARRVAEEALTRFPRDAGLHDMLGRLLQTSGETGADRLALEHFRQAAQLEPKTGLYLERYGTACLRNNLFVEACAAFETAQELNPTRAYPYQQLAAVYSRMGDPKKASMASKYATDMVYNDQLLTRIQALSNKDPKNAGYHLVLARRYQEVRLAGAAREHYLGVLALDPANGEAKRGATNALVQLAEQEKLKAAETLAKRPVTPR